MAANMRTHGWTAVPRSFNTLLSSKSNLGQPKTLLIRDIAWPVDAIVTNVRDFAKDKLTEQTFNHSMRVFYWGNALILSLIKPYPSHVLFVSRESANVGSSAADGFNIH